MPCSWFPPADEVDEDASQDVLFTGLAFGDQKGHGDEGAVGDAFGPVWVVQGVVFLHKPEEQGRADPLVASTKG